MTFPPANFVVRATAADYISRWNPQYRPKFLDIFDIRMNIPRNLKGLQALVSSAQEVSVYFKVPNQKMLSNLTPLPSSSPNQLVASFINFLLLMIEVIIYLESSCTSCGRFSIERRSIENLRTELELLIQNLQTELGFLITFLGDTTMHLQPVHTNNIIRDIEVVVNQVGSFIFSYVLTLTLHLAITIESKNRRILDIVNIEAMQKEVAEFLHSIDDGSPGTKSRRFFCFCCVVEEINNTATEIKDVVHQLQSLVDFFVASENDQVQEAGILDLSISNLLQKFDLLNTKIKEHCVEVSKMPSDHTAPNTTLVSFCIVDSVLDDLMYLINNKSHWTDGVGDQIVRLHEEMMLLGSSVNKLIEKQQAEHEQLIMQTVDVAYEVEYVINSLPPIWYLNLRLPQVIRKIQLITMDIIKINKQIDAAGEKQVEKYQEGQALPSPSRRTPVLEINLVGFKELEVEIAEQLLFGGTQQRQVICIFGMPGLGKTTLANKLYNHPSVVNRFHCRAWCVSSQTYNKRNMLNDILMSLGNKNIGEDEDLGGKVYEFIKGRRYLLVIDDIWDVDAWNDLKRYFPDDGIGSRIVFTTRNKEVGLEASASLMKELPFLSDVECWELLQRKVFQEENCPQELLDVGKKIASKCQGLPLAVVVIAGVLTNMEKKEHLWQKVESKISSHIAEAESPDNCMQILELSYRHLPIHLKPCFLYFGAFKEDAEIPVEMLKSIWIAERFIKKEEGKSLEDVATEYLMKLIDRSLILVSKRRSNGQVKTCKIHDILLDMCLRKVEENCFFKEVKFSDHDRVLCHQHHSLIFTCNSEDSFIAPFGLHLRSLLCFGVKFPMLMSCSFKVLKVFHFDETSDFPLIIGIEHLVQLRYLAVRCDIPRLLIQKCHKLEFLEVKIFTKFEITEDYLNVVNLRYMHFNGGAYFSKSFRRQATNDESFQKNNKVLQSISKVNISDEIDEKILRCFPNLRRLAAKFEGSFSFSFDFFHQLESLKLEASSSTSFISLPLNLKYFTLVDGHISPGQMEMIERLEYLEVLKLDKVKFEREQWDTSESAFPQLKVLKLIQVEISEWNASSDTFSSLQRLVLRQCNCLEMIPSNFSDILTLQRIELIGCPKSVRESAKQIEKYQKEMGNEELQVIEADY